MSANSLTPYVMALHLGALELEVNGFHELAATLRLIIAKEVRP